MMRTAYEENSNRFELFCVLFEKTIIRCRIERMAIDTTTCSKCKEDVNVADNYCARCGNFLLGTGDNNVFTAEYWNEFRYLFGQDKYFRRNVINHWITVGGNLFLVGLIIFGLKFFGELMPEVEEVRKRGYERGYAHGQADLRDEIRKSFTTQPAPTVAPGGVQVAPPPMLPR